MPGEDRSTNLIDFYRVFLDLGFFRNGRSAIFSSQRIIKSLSVFKKDMGIVKRGSERSRFPCPQPFYLQKRLERSQSLLPQKGLTIFWPRMDKAKMFAFNFLQGLLKTSRILLPFKIIGDPIPQRRKSAFISGMVMVKVHKIFERGFHPVFLRVEVQGEPGSISIVKVRMPRTLGYWSRIIFWSRIVWSISDSFSKGTPRVKKRSQKTPFDFNWPRDSINA